MPTLDEKFIADIRKPASGQIIYRDDQLIGFGLRVTPTRNTFIVETRVEGKVKRMTLGQLGFMTVDEARVQAHKLLSSIDCTRLRKMKGAPTLHQVVEAYVAARPLRRSTIVNYRKAVRLHLGDWTVLPVTDITEDMVVARHKELGEKLKGNTANSVMCALRSMLNFAAENYKTVDGQPVLRSNPVSKLSRTQSWYRKQRRHHVIPDHQLAAWYKAMMAVTGTSHNVSDYLLLLILTGLRRNEGATLRWSDIDFKARTLTVRGEIAKNHRSHVLPLSEFLTELLLRRRNGLPDAEYVFPGRYGGHMVSYLRCFRRIEMLSGCKFMLHDLRRTFISVAAKLGVQHQLTKRLLNHLSGRDDTDGYVIISAEDLRTPMEQINGRILELMGVLFPNSNLLCAHRPSYANITLEELLNAYFKTQNRRRQTRLSMPVH